MQKSQSIELQCKQFSYSLKGIRITTDNNTAFLKELYNLITRPDAVRLPYLVQAQNVGLAIAEGIDEKTAHETLYKGNLSKSDLKDLKEGKKDPKTGKRYGGYDDVKRDLGFYVPSGIIKHGHKADDLTDFNGFIGLDIDLQYKGGYEKAKATKAALSKFDFIPFLHHSSGNNGVKGLMLTDLKECDSDLYQFAQRQIFAYLSSQGIDLGKDKHAYGKTCFFAYDKDAYLNLNATSFHIDLEAYEKEKAVKKAQNERKTVVITSNDEVEQAVKFLIDNKINVANCYDEYLSFTRACLNTFGTEGGDIAFQILENSDAFNVSTFKSNFDANVQRLLQPSNGGKATERSILFHARENGFRFQEIAESKPFDAEFNHLDLFIVDRAKALQRVKMDTLKKIVVCEDSYTETAVNVLNGKRFDGKNTDVDTLICTYKDLSKLGMINANIYGFGCQNFVRQPFINTASEIEKLSKHAKTVLFADTPTHLNIAKRIITIDRHTPYTDLIISENAQATFVELIKKELPNNAQFLDAPESINKQLFDYQLIKRSELYNADHSKPLYVLCDKNVGMMPEAFTQFKKVVFIVNSEKKPCVNMSTFCAQMDKSIDATLRFTDTNYCYGAIEKALFEDVTRKVIPIRHNNGQWERCPNTEGVLENEHQIKILTSDVTAMQAHIERISINSKDFAYITEETETISETIKQTKKDLATEKKVEFFEFLDKVENLEIASLTDLVDFVSKQDEMSRGAKVAYTRLKILLKLNDSFSTCFDAVKDSYNRWTQTRGRFRASKTVKTSTKIGKSLQLFRDTTEGAQYAKPELIEAARSLLPMVNGNDKEVWKKLKTYCFLTAKKGRQDGHLIWLYETIFLE
jgi:VirE N-terminal domain